MSACVVVCKRPLMLACVVFVFFVVLLWSFLVCCSVNVMSACVCFAVLACIVDDYVYMIVFRREVCTGLCPWIGQQFPWMRWNTVVVLNQLVKSGG